MSVEAYGVRSTVATSNHTQNYDLPLWVGGDVTSWMGNLNDAFNKIDSAIWEAQKSVNGIQEIGENLQKLFDEQTGTNAEVKQALTDQLKLIEDANTAIQQLNSDMTNANTAIENLNTEHQSSQMQIEALQDDIGKMMSWLSGKIISFEHPITVSDGITVVTASNYGTYISLQLEGLETDKWIDIPASLDALKQILTELGLPENIKAVAGIPRTVPVSYDVSNLYSYGTVYWNNAEGTWHINAWLRAGITQTSIAFFVGLED